MGCDDIEACRYTEPPLTTVKQDKQKIGRLAAMVLFDLMNKQMNTKCIKVEPELVIRSSCGPATLEPYEGQELAYALKR